MEKQRGPSAATSPSERLDGEPSDCRVDRAVPKQSPRNSHPEKMEDQQNSFPCFLPPTAFAPLKALRGAPENKNQITKMKNTDNDADNKTGPDNSMGQPKSNPRETSKPEIADLEARLMAWVSDLWPLSPPDKPFTELEQAKIAALYTFFRPGHVRYAAFREVQDPEAVANKAFLKALTHYDPNRKAAFKTYLWLVLCFEILTDLKRKSRRSKLFAPMPEDFDTSDPAPAQKTELRDLGEELEAALQKLPAKDRELLRMMYFEELSLKEIARLRR